MTIARACRPPTRDYAGGWHAAGGLLSTLLGGCTDNGSPTAPVNDRQPGCSPK